jgi:MYXO-CTERM domain-containing protein
MAVAQTSNQQNAPGESGSAGSAITQTAPGSTQGGNTAQSTDAARNGNASATDPNESRSGSGNWGWIGLLGLIGLAGLRTLRRSDTGTYRQSAAAD